MGWLVAAALALTMELIVAGLQFFCFFVVLAAPRVGHQAMVGQVHLGLMVWYFSCGTVGTLGACAGGVGLSCTCTSHMVVRWCCVVSGKSGMVLVLCGSFNRSASYSNSFCNCLTGVVVGMLMLWWNQVS